MIIENYVFSSEHFQMMMIQITKKDVTISCTSHFIEYLRLDTNVVWLFGTEATEGKTLLYI